MAGRRKKSFFMVTVLNFTVIARYEAIPDLESCSV